MQQPSTIPSCHFGGSAYGEWAGQSNGCWGEASILDHVLSTVLSQRPCSVPALSGSRRNVPYARSLVVTRHRNRHRLDNENHRGRQGVRVGSGCATRYHRSICRQLDRGGAEQNSNLLVQLRFVYDLGSGGTTVADTFLRETPNLTPATRFILWALTQSAHSVAGSMTMFAWPTDTLCDQAQWCHLRMGPRQIRFFYATGVIALAQTNEVLSSVCSQVTRQHARQSFGLDC